MQGLGSPARGLGFDMDQMGLGLGAQVSHWVVGLGFWVYNFGFGVYQLFHGLQVGSWGLGAGVEGVKRI